MLRVDLGCDMANAFVDHVQRLGPTSVVMVLCPTARRFTVRIEDGGEVELYVGKVKAVDSIIHTVCSRILKRTRETHHYFRPCGGVRQLSISGLIECRPVRMLCVIRRTCSDGGQRNPQSESHTFSLN